MNLDEPLAQSARRLAAQHVRFVLAESCTGGLAAAALVGVPGISEWLCGSLVSYRDRSKIEWLGVSADDLAARSAVSSTVAAQMARGALEQTGEAVWSASVTGHLGPDAPAGLDGVVYVAVARRHGEAIVVERSAEWKLTATSRDDRQREAAQRLLDILSDSIAAARTE
jgi:PncC family amidohydrolase